MHTCLSILITLLLSVLGFGPDAKADVRDHLGGTRAVIDDTGELLQTVNYYPYGMPFPETANIQPYKYSKKELDMANGLNQYDFGARWYSHSTALFTTQDPLSEKYYALSPYTYCTGNPIMFIDPTGKETKAFVDERYESDRFISLAAAKYPSNNDIQIFAHGNTDKIAIFIDGKTSIIKSHTELLGIINNHFTSGKTITSKTNRTIVLHSCKTGSGKNSVAQKISKEMPNATIIAPDGFLIVGSKDGALGVSKTKNALDKQGHWNVFKDGKVVNTLPHDTKPNGDPGYSIYHSLLNYISNIFKR